MKKILLVVILLFSMLSCTTEDGWNGPKPYTYCSTITGKFITKTCNGTTISSGACIGKSDINYILLLSGNETRVVSKEEYHMYNQGNLYCTTIYPNKKN